MSRLPSSLRSAGIAIAVCLMFLPACPSEPGVGTENADANVGEEDGTGDNADEDINDDSNDDPSVEFTDIVPDPQDQNPVVMSEDEVMSFEFTTENCEDCTTDCNINGELHSDCQSPFELQINREAHEGDNNVFVEIPDAQNPGSRAEVDFSLAITFDFGVEGLSEEEVNEVTYPTDHDLQCDRDDCRLECSSSGLESISACEPDGTFSLQLTETSASLTVTACAEDVEIPDYDHCFEKSYDIEYTAPRWETTAGGNNHTCGILDDGSLWCWGDNTAGKLGIGNSNTSEVATPTRVEIDGAENAQWRTVSTGREHTCGVTVDDELFCWGSDNEGQLGIGDQSGIQAAPVEIGVDKNWETVAAGGEHTCGLTTAGTLYCWGDDGWGQLGNGDDNGDVPVDTPVSNSLVENDNGDDWSSITAGSEHTCAIDTGDTAWCWGRASDGRLGNGDDSGSVHEPDVVSAFDDWEDFHSITTGRTHTCTGVNGEIRCWGDGEYSQTGSSDDQASPGLVNNTGEFSTVTAGGDHSCGLAQDGTGYCWGRMNNGQLGNGETESVDTALVPEEVHGDHAFSTITAGNFHTCAIEADTQELYCWGNANNGRLGNDDSDGGILNTPQPVVWPFAP